MLQYSLNQNNKNKYILLMLTILVLSIIVQSCKVRNTPLRFYKRVATDSEFPRSEVKKSLLAPVFLAEFPQEQKTIIKDSIVIKSVRVIDNAKINSLQNQIEILKKAKPNINIDSLYTNFYDSVLKDLPECKQIEHYKEKEDKHKDTIGNYFSGLELSRYKRKNDTLSTLLVDVNYQLSEQKKKSDLYKKDVNYWRIRFFVLLGLICIYFGLYVFLKIKKTISITPVI